MQLKSILLSDLAQSKRQIDTFPNLCVVTNAEYKNVIYMGKIDILRFVCRLFYTFKEKRFSKYLLFIELVIDGVCEACGCEVD